MKQNRLAQVLRTIALTPALESEDASSAVTSDGDNIVSADVKPVDETPADGAGAPGEDQVITAKVVEVGERSELETAETTSTDSQEDKPTTSTESEVTGDDSSAVTGDGDNIVKADIKPVDETPADGSGAPGEDEKPVATIVEVGERSELETAETVATDSQDTTVSTESITLATLGFIGISAALSGWMANKYSSALEELYELTETVNAKRAELKAADEEFKRRAEVVIAKAKAEGKLKDHKETVSQEGALNVGVGAAYAGLMGYIWGPVIGPLISLGVWGSSWAAAAKKLRQQHQELEALELKLADRQLDMATRVAEAEKKFKVSQESDTTDTDSSAVTGDGDETINAANIKAIDETPADGAGAPGEDEKPATTLVDVGERSELEAAETTSDDSQDLNVSQEGIAGAVIGFIVGSAGWTPFVGGAIHGAAKVKRLKLREDIQTIATRIEQVRRGQLAEAQKKGLSVPENLKNVDMVDIIKSAFIGQFFGSFYGAYQGSDLENLNRELREKLAELEKEVKLAGISTESLASLESDGGEQAAAAAAAFAEGAAGAAEVVAAAVHAEAPEVMAADTSIEVPATDAVPVEGEVPVAEGDVVETTEPVDESDVEELSDAIDEGEASIEKYEQGAATMESLICALEEAKQSGGLTPQSAKFFQIGFESVGRTLTGQPFKNAHGEAAIPSLESFGGTMRRDTATNVSLESAKEWFAKIWEVLKATLAQVKEWLGKFYEAVFTESGRLRKRAQSLKSAAGKVTADDLKSKEMTTPKSVGDRIVLGSALNVNHVMDLVPFVKEAGARGSEASRAIIQMRLDLQNMIRNAGQGGKLSDTTPASGDSAMKGELRSAVFSIPFESDGRSGFKTKELPGNVEFAAFDPLSSGQFSEVVMSVFRGWKVVKLENGAKDVDKYVTATLTRQQMTAVADSVLQVLDAVEAAKDSLKEEALSVADLKVPEEVPGAEARKIKAMAWATGRIIQAQSSSIGQILKYAISTSSAYLDFAAIALKQYDTAKS